MEVLFSIEGLVSLFTLTFLEIVLGIDNIIFISIISGRLPLEQQGKARNIGIILALVVRILMLLGVSWIIGLRATIFTIGTFSLSYRDLILIAGGLFLLAKSTSEMHAKLEGGHDEKNVKAATFQSTIIQIVLLDVVFSIRLDSNSRRSRGKPADHHYRYCHIAGYNAHIFEKNKLLYQRTPYHENSWYFIFAHDRCASDFGGLSCSRSERLHLFLHGICTRR